MKKLLPKQCARDSCRVTYVPSGPAQKYCEDCIPLVRKEAARIRSYAHAIKKGRIKQPGIGSGNARRANGQHTRFTNGRGIYPTIAYEAHGFDCAHCGIDVRTLRSSQRAVHHKDRNRRNNHPDNLEVMCRACHAREHEVVHNLPVK
jgi:5-methylcytosine-specific restriction endonuclease McrA